MVPHSFAYILAKFDPAVEIYMWLIFIGVIATFLIVDLGILHKKAEVISTKSAIYQSLFWIAVSVGFGFFILNFYDPDGDRTNVDAFNEYLGAYIMEYALSIDNIFVIILILKYFKVKEENYHNVLFWGIAGAMVMRAFFIYVGGYLIQHIDFVLYLFGAFLLYTGYKMFFHNDSAEEVNHEQNPVLRFARRYLKFTDEDHGDKFAVRINGKLYFTQLFMVLLLVESSDVIFAVDSIPAAFGISKDPTIIYTANIFAVMGLRAMFFMLSGIMDKFHLLGKGLSIILAFIGAKMLAEGSHDLAYVIKSLFYANAPAPGWVVHLEHFHLKDHITPTQSLSIIVTVLGATMLLSVLLPPRGKSSDA